MIRRDRVDEGELPYIDRPQAFSGIDYCGWRPWNLKRRRGGVRTFIYYVLRMQPWFTLLKVTKRKERLCQCRLDEREEASLKHQMMHASARCTSICG